MLNISTLIEVWSANKLENDIVLNNYIREVIILYYGVSLIQFNKKIIIL